MGGRNNCRSTYGALQSRKRSRAVKVQGVSGYELMLGVLSCNSAV